MMVALSIVCTSSNISKKSSLELNDTEFKLKCIVLIAFFIKQLKCVFKT